jgi:glyoxylase-like metal-dependent hydrolase (beta-lactamase superfamily II)
MRWSPEFRVGSAFIAAVVLLGACAAPSESADPLLRQSLRSMGGESLRTLRYAASGTGTTFGQAWVPGTQWPRITVPSFTRVIDYDNAAMREDSIRVRAEPNGGGALPLMGTGEQRVSGLVRGDYAWNLVGPAPVPAPVALDGRIHDLWTTPHGVLRSALRNQATMRRDGAASVVSFAEPGRFRATVRIGADGLVEQVDSVHPHPVMGDTQVTTVYSGYRDHGGVKFPSRIRQQQGGHEVYDLTVTEVQPHAPAAIELPALVQAFAERVAAEKVAEGVWHLAGGSHNSVLIEMSDYLLLVESPLYDGRALAVIAEARRLAPGKPIRYVVNSHHHFDHAGGLRTAASTGATLVVSEQARPWFERAFATPNRIRPDALAQSGRTPALTGVSGSRSLGDASRPVQVFLIDGSIHAQGFLMVWLPRERLLIQADAFTPGAPGSAPPSPANLNNVNLAQNIDRLRLDVDRILPLHGRVVPLAELHRMIGRGS